MSRTGHHAHGGSDVNPTSNVVTPQVRISTGRGLKRATAAIHLKRKIEFYEARDEYRALVKELSDTRVKAFAEAAVAGMGLDQDAPL